MPRPYQSYSSPEGVYLSVDLDFWARAVMSRNDQAWLLSILKRAESVRCFKRHDEALAHVNSPEIAAKGKELWNLDTHSDLAGWDVTNTPPALNEGTWVDHVKWPKAERFLWIHPDPQAAKAKGRGRCEGSFPNPFRTRHPVWPARRHCTRPRRLQEVDLPSRLIGACVILSPPWYETGEAKAKAVQVFNKIKQQLTI